MTNQNSKAAINLIYRKIANINLKVSHNIIDYQNLIISLMQIRNEIDKLLVKN